MKSKLGQKILGKRLMIVVLLAGMAACAQTNGSLSPTPSGTAAESISARYPEGSFQSTESADQALAAVREEREKTRAQFQREKQACYERFFTNLCLDDIDERERIATEELRRVEVEANAFKRRARAASREERAQQQDKRRLHIPSEATSSPGNQENEGEAAKIKE